MKDVFMREVQQKFNDDDYDYQYEEWLETERQKLKDEKSKKKVQDKRDTGK